MIPPIYNRSYSISADLDNPGRSGALGLRPGVAGVIVAESSFLGGFSLYVENGYLKHTYSLLGLKLDTISSRDALPAGKVNVRYEFTADKPGEFGTGGTSRLFINGKQQAEAKMNIACRSDSPHTQAWTSAPTTGSLSSRNSNM